MRWLFIYRKKKTIKEVAKDDWFKNSYVGILFFALIGGLTYSLFN